MFIHCAYAKEKTAYDGLHENEEGLSCSYEHAHWIINTRGDLVVMYFIYSPNC